MSHQDRESVVSVLHDLSQTIRPHLLLRTARHGTLDYHRETDLRRILRMPAPPRPGPAVVRALLELEAQQEEQRTRPAHEVGNPWRAARHVEILIALICEAQMMAQSVPSAPTLVPDLPAVPLSQR